MPEIGSAQARDPVAGFVGDLRLLTVSLPTSAGWTPATLTTGSLVPGRAFGGEVGAHFVLGPGRHRRLGLGASALLGQGRATGTDGAATVTTRLSTGGATRLVELRTSPRLELCERWCGHGQGLVGSGRWASRPERLGSGSTYGAGARWFLAERVAVSLDLRFWALSPRDATANRPRAPARTQVAFGAGLSLR